VSGHSGLRFGASKSGRTFSWDDAEFVWIIKRHAKGKAKCPDEGPATGYPYNGIENLRPDSKATVESFLFYRCGCC